MALLWIDGFDNFGTTTNSAPAPTGIVGRKYVVASESNMKVQTGRISGYSLGLSASAQTMAKSGLTTNSTVVIGFAIYFTTWDNAQTFMSLRSGGVSGYQLAINAFGELTIYNNGSLVAVTSGLHLMLNTWYYVEFKVHCASGGAGTYEVRVGGAVGASGSATIQPNGTDYHDGFAFNGTSFTSIRIDDLYFLDASGALNTTFLGNRKVQTLRPNAAGGSNQWATDSGAASSSNYTHVDESQVNDDTDYIQDGTSGDIDTYNYTTISSMPSVTGIQINTVCKETDATNFSLITRVYSGTTTSDDGGQTIGSTTYVFKTRLLETDPDTSSAWGTSAIDSIQVGVKVG
jgi:hypothetical protein